MDILKTNTKLIKLIAITMAVAAPAVIGSFGTADRADASGPTADTGWSQKSVIATIPGTTLGSGQTLRFSLVNPNTPEQVSEPVSAQARLYDAQGNVLARSQEVELPPGQFRTFDFNRDDLPAAREPGTGRLQVRAEIIYLFTDSQAQISPDHFPASMELFDNETGTTNLIELFAHGWAQKSVIATIPSTGLVPGQMLRFSVVNPTTPEQISEPISAQVRLYDAQGNVLARSQEMELPPGQFRSFDFNRDDLPGAGETGTGRLQVRAEIIHLFIASQEQISPDHFPASMELFDNRNGRHEGAFMGNLFSATPVARQQSDENNLRFIVEFEGLTPAPTPAHCCSIDQEP